jgi:addiction module HigA family antidote
MPKTTTKNPGSVLKSFLEEYQLNPSKLAAAVKLSQSTIRQITLNKMKISTPIALRFAKFFGNPVEFWIDVQSQYDIAESAKDPELSAILKDIQKAKKPAPGEKAESASAKGGAKKTGAPGKSVNEKKGPRVKKTDKPAAAGRTGRKPKVKE